MMSLTDLTINEFSVLLASSEPAPGGGSASALACAVGVGLVAMAASLTVGREKYREFEDELQGVLAEAAALKSKALVGINRDTEAYTAVTDVFKMPKSTDEEKAARRDAMQNSLKQATLVPFELMELCLSGIALVERACGKINHNCQSDLGVAAINLKSAAQGAWLNVLINLGGINDKAFADEYKKRGEEILSKAESSADAVYRQVLENL